MFFRKRNAVLEGQTNRPPWRVIIPVVVGLAVAALAWWYLQQYIATHQETETIIVPAHDIPANKVIEQGDLTSRTIIFGGREPNTVADNREIVWKMASVKLYKGEQIRKERLAEPVAVNLPVVTVNINPVRANGVEPGSIVDVYWVQSENTPGALLAADATVKAVMDAGGVQLTEKAAGVAAAVAQAAQPNQGTPAMVALYVKMEEVPQVIRGAAEGNKNIVLVKKAKPGGTTTVVQQPPGNAEQETSNTNNTRKEE